MSISGSLGSSVRILVRIKIKCTNKISTFVLFIIQIIVTNKCMNYESLSNFRLIKETVPTTFAFSRVFTWQQVLIITLRATYLELSILHNNCVERLIVTDVLSL